MLYEDAFLDKVEFGAKTYTDFQGGGNDVKECVAGYPALKHLSIPLGLVMRSFPVLEHNKCRPNFKCDGIGKV